MPSTLIHRICASPAWSPSSFLFVLLFVFTLYSSSLSDVPGLRFIRHPESTVALPGSEVTFDCALNVSADRVEWLHRNQPLHASSRGSLVIQLSNETDKYAEQSGTYQCVAWFGASAMASLPAELQVATLQQQPLRTQPTRFIYQVAPGNNVALSCPPPPSIPPAQVHFMRNGHRITAPVSPSGTILLVDVTLADSGMYTCSATNSYLNRNVTLPYVVQLKVEPSTRPQAPRFLTSPSSNYNALAGSDVRLECPAVGWPVPKMTWKKYGGSLPLDRSKTLFSGVLQLSTVTYADEGTYICEPGNSVDSRIKCVIMLQVKEPPSIVKEPASLIVEEGGELHLQCIAKGHPMPSISWVRNGESVDKDKQISANDTKLYIKQVEKRHAGIFQCFATNSVGTAFGMAMLQVQPRPIASRPSFNETNQKDDVDDSEHHSRGPGYKPNKKRKPGNPKPHKTPMIPPSQPYITRLSNVSVMVRWSVPSDEGLPIQFFKVQYRDLGSRRKSEWKTVDEDIPPHIRSFEVDNLKTDHHYRFRIAAVYSNQDHKTSPNSARFHLQNEPATKRPLYPPVLSHAEALSPSAIEIEWQYTEVPSTPIVGFFIHYRSTTMAGDYSKATVLGEQKRSFVITHLLPDNSYDIKMQSFNDAGTSDFSAISSHRTQYVPTTPEPGRGGTHSPSLSGDGGLNGLNLPNNEGGSQHVGMVVGTVLGGLLILLLLLSVGVYVCKHSGSRTAVAEHDQAKEVQAYGLAAVGKPLTNGTSHHLHLHHRHLSGPRVHITANPLAAAADHYKSDGELEVSSQNNNCAALLEPANRRLASMDDSTDEGDEGADDIPPRPLPSGHCENYV